MTNPDGVADFRPTHVVPQEGLPAWEAPDVSRPTTALDAFLPVQLLSRRGEWGEILCANGWSAWVDGRLLVAVPQPPPTAGKPLTRTEDPRPLLARTADALDRYRRAADELGSGRVDAEAFRRGIRGLRAGMVLDGESVWLYDEAAGRWMYGDGARLTTYAVAEGPGARATPDPQGGASDPDPGGAADAADSTGGQPGVPPGRAKTGHDPTRIVDAAEGGGH